MIIFNQVCRDKIHNLSFNISRGEFVYIYHQDREVLELLRDLICGMATPASGIIKWLNYYNYKADVLKGEMGIVFPANILMADRTLAENFRFIMNIKGLSYSLFKNRLDKVLDTVGLKDYRNCLPGDLLNHQLVRANIAQALLGYPSLLVVDNPLQELDEVNSQAIIALLREINQLSMTIVMFGGRVIRALGDSVRVLKLDTAEKLEKKKGLNV